MGFFLQRRKYFKSRKCLISAIPCDTTIGGFGKISVIFGSFRSPEMFMASAPGQSVPNTLMH